MRELDDKVISCKEFEDRNRGAFDQVMTDIARLGESIADYERLKSESEENINVKETEITTMVEMIKKEETIYTKILYENRREMTIRKNDLAVFQFMMQLTKCQDESALMQLRQQKPQ